MVASKQPQPEVAKEKQSEKFHCIEYFGKETCFPVLPFLKIAVYCAGDDCFYAIAYSLFDFVLYKLNDCHTNGIGFCPAVFLRNTVKLKSVGGWYPAGNMFGLAFFRSVVFLAVLMRRGGGARLNSRGGRRRRRSFNLHFPRRLIFCSKKV